MIGGGVSRIVLESGMSKIVSGRQIRAARMLVGLMPLPVDTYDANQIVLLEQRDDQEGSDSTRFHPGDRERIATCICFQLPNTISTSE